MNPLANAGPALAEQHALDALEQLLRDDRVMPTGELLATISRSSSTMRLNLSRNSVPGLK